MVRAQLSKYELLLLYYNCLSDVGEKFRPLVERYDLLKMVNTTELLDEAHMGRYRPEPPPGA